MNNSAAFFGGGIYADVSDIYSSSKVVLLTNSLFNFNKAAVGAGIKSTGFEISI